jgi:hypothetical protein
VGTGEKKEVLAVSFEFLDPALLLAALLGELFSRLFLIHGDTHIDPPANAIWVMATVVFVLSLLFG